MGDSPQTASFRERLRLAVGAWQPLTGRGIAAFAGASAGRLLVFQLLIAAMVAATAIWSARKIVLPVVQEAMTSLPDGAAGIRGGQFRWPDSSPVLLANSPHLAVTVDPGSESGLGLNGDVQIELHPGNLSLRGLLGSVDLPYPPELDLPLDRTSAAATWGAWQTPLLGLLGLGVFAFQLTVFWILPAIEAGPAWMLSWVLRKALTLHGAYRIASASLWPAALIPAAAVVLYTSLWVRIPGLTALTVLHILAGWIWLTWGILSLPARPPRETSPAPNPFQNSPSGGRTSKAKTRRQNPFTR